MIAPDLDTVRLFLHLVAATVWVGGQLTLAALVPVLRRTDAGAVQVAARAFSRLAWPAFGLLVVTGLWNVQAERDEITGEYRTTLLVKLAAVAVSGVAAAAHTHAGSARSRAVLGALTGVSALAALFFGVLLRS